MRFCPGIPIKLDQKEEAAESPENFAGNEKCVCNFEGAEQLHVFAISGTFMSQEDLIRKNRYG